MRIGTVYPDREAYRGPSIQPYFLSGLRSYVEHRCIDNPDSECVSGQSIPIEKRIGTLLYNRNYCCPGCEAFGITVANMILLLFLFGKKK